MQLGVRWRAGDAPHHSVPPELHDAIVQQESLHPQASAWTLTWLEGRPRCVLDDAVTLRLDAAGNVRVESQPSEPVQDDDGDGWLD